MLNNEQIRTTLVNAAILSVSRVGLENATTRVIGEFAEMNATYIYRYFIDKEDLLRRAYVQENTAYIGKILEKLENIKKSKETLSTKAATLWSYCVNYLLDRPDTCRFLRYYYNSPNLKNYVFEEHTHLFLKLKESVKPLCPDDERAELFIYYLLDSVFCLCMRALNEELNKTQTKRLIDLTLQMTIIPTINNLSSC